MIFGGNIWKTTVQEYCGHSIFCEKWKKCKINRKHSSKTFVKINFNEDYYKINGVELIDEDLHRYAFNGSGIVSQNQPTHNPSEL